jgi:hypothetical protein
MLVDNDFLGLGNASPYAGVTKVISIKRDPEISAFIKTLPAGTTENQAQAAWLAKTGKAYTPISNAIPQANWLGPPPKAPGDKKTSNVGASVNLEGGMSTGTKFLLAVLIGAPVAYLGYTYFVKKPPATATNPRRRRRRR